MHEHDNDDMYRNDVSCTEMLQTCNGHAFESRSRSLPCVMCGNDAFDIVIVCNSEPSDLL